jgi:hypothetical protein
VILRTSENILGAPLGAGRALTTATLGYLAMFAAVTFAWAAFLYSVIRSQ